MIGCKGETFNCLLDVFIELDGNEPLMISSEDQLVAYEASSILCNGQMRPPNGPMSSNQSVNET